MSEPSETGTGRSRGRARGRASMAPSTPIEQSIHGMQAIRISPTGSDGNGNGNGSNGNGNGNGSDGAAAQRGRGGFRGLELDTRPQTVTQYIGTIGKEVNVLSNYIQMNTPTTAIVNNFDVKFEPQMEAPAVRRRMIYGIQDLFGKVFIFDGMSNIKTTDSNRTDRSHLVPNPANVEQMIKITIKWTEEVPWGSPEMLRMFNTQMRRNLQHLSYKLIGRNYFDIRTKQSIPEFKIELMSGLVTAIAQHDAGLLMVIDTTTKFIRSETVLQILGQLRNKCGPNWLNEAKKQLCGSIVMTTYNNRTYKIDDLKTGPEENPEKKRFKKGDREMTLSEYYKEQYNITVIGTQPLIECLPSMRDRRAGRTDKLLLIPELCKMTGLTEEMRKDFNLMRKVGDISRLKPKERVKNLEEFLKKLNTNPEVKKDMSNWQLSYSDQLVSINARELPCERIYCGNDDDLTAQLFQQKTGDFSKEMRSKRLWSAVSLNKWMIIVTQRDATNTQDFISTMRRVCGPMGFGLGEPRVKQLDDDRVGGFINALQGLQGMGCQMVVCIVPNQNKERYDAIKKITYCESPLPSQVIVGKTISKKQMLMSVCTKIAIQMATKLGGEPWALKIPPKDLMVIGYDTYHDSSDNRRSVGGFVCSLNPTLTSWYSRAVYHENKEEMSSKFAQNILEGIKRYFDRRKSLPLRIVIYRDGVGDGQIPHVFNYELKQIQEGLAKISPDNPLKFTFIIVTKRVNARFFSAEGRDLDNPIPGTVIDKTVTRLMRYDFYLISQSVRQGTVTPTMYNIIYDTTGLKAEHHQQLAYKLTHLYFNWPGTIRVPAPCQYAHKLAYLTGTSLHREPNSVLSDRLFYL